MKVIQFSGTPQKHAHQHGLKACKSLISIHKSGLSTQSAFALSTTTILFYKKEDKKTVKVPVKNKNLVAL
jgi:hypothetical protein